MRMTQHLQQTAHTKKLPTPELPTPELPTTELPTTELPTPELPTPELPTPELPTPEISTPEISTPEISTPEISTPEISTPELPTPEVPTLEVSTPELPTTSEELDSEPLEEPVEMIDGLFDFVTFNTDTDVVLKEVEQDGKDFDLEAYVTDQSESPTSASQESGASSASSSPGNSVSPILPPQEIESNNTKVNTPVSNIGFGKGQGKNFAALMKCYNKDKPLFQKSKEDTENTKKSLAKSLKDNELKAPKDVKMAEEKDLKPNKEKDLKPVKLEDYKPVKEKQARLVKKKDVKPIKIENAEPTKEKLFKVKDLQPANEQGMKLLKEEKVKSDRENKLKPVKVEVKPCKENKERIGEKITKKMGNHSSEQKVHSSAQTSTNNAQDTSDKLDDFAKAIVASMVVAHRKPNLEKRRNSEMRKRLCHFQEHSLKFQKYLSDQREPPKMNVLHPTTNAINMNSKTPSQLQQSTGNTSSVALKTRPQQQQKIKTENCAQIVNANTVELKATPYQNVKIENCSPTGNSNNADWKTQQQQQNIKSENCAPTDHTETPAGARKISIQEYLNRKRSYHSSNNGSDVGNDSNIPTKKRISINEYMKRKVVA
ncbi:proteoglycan 4-like [Bradysia coprophila]|uniref:proteoglycan 4-like n=1 Tax=Bradysia coprophila TaxID=38358 RepID=UPI00187D768C|nr:proteoglycan 4-like [Bradysia coprophila]